MRPNPLIPTLIFPPCSAAASLVGASGERTARVLDAFLARRTGWVLPADDTCSTGLDPRTKFLAARGLAWATFFPAAFGARSVGSVSEVLRCRHCSRDRAFVHFSGSLLSTESKPIVRGRLRFLQRHLETTHDGRIDGEVRFLLSTPPCLAAIFHTRKGGMRLAARTCCVGTHVHGLVVHHQVRKGCHVFVRSAASLVRSIDVLVLGFVETVGGFRRRLEATTSNDHPTLGLGSPKARRGRVRSSASSAGMGSPRAIPRRVGRSRHVHSRDWKDMEPHRCGHANT